MQVDTKTTTDAQDKPYITFTDANFQAEVLDAEGLVLVDYWAEWCGPCHMLAPHIEAVANEFKDKVKVGKLNVDENRETASTYGILSIPTMMIFKGGQLVAQDVGVKSREMIVQWLVDNGMEA